jgi:hypothetical protein
MSLSKLGTQVAWAVGGSAVTALSASIYSAITKKVSDETLGKAVAGAKAAMAVGKADSLISYSQAARVEPILLMDQKAIYVPFIQDVVHTMNSLFTAYYLQSISLDTTLSGIKVIKRLDKFNPDRSLAEATSAFFSQESFAHGLPFLGESVGLEAYGVKPSMESNHRRPMTQSELDDALTLALQQDAIKQEVSGPELERSLRQAEIREFVEKQYPKDTPEKRLERALQDAEIKKFVEDQFSKKENVSSLSTKDMTKMVTDVTNLAVGKVVEVSISENDQTARIPVTIRLRVTSMPSNVLTETLAVGGVDVTAKSRWKAWRAGELRFWGDIILAQDRIDAHREAIRKDSSGYYAAVQKRADKNLAAEVLGSGPSVGTASSIIVITEQTRKDLERKIGGRLSDYKTRQNIFINTYSMLMCVVDPDYETVTIYHRGIEMPTELSAKYIQASNKGNGPDVAEVLKAYQLGSAPHRL